MKKIAVFLILFVAQAALLFSQTLTVSEIMAEPSIAGMRVEGERLSPDGKTVVFLWNAEGKMPLDLYSVSTSGGAPRKILSPKDLPTQRTQEEKENKLDYGLIVKDDFVKARENQIGNFVWSPDSKKLLLSHSGDLFILNVELNSTNENNLSGKNKWESFEAAVQRRADLVPIIFNVVKKVGIQEQEFFGQIAEYRSRLLNALLEKPLGLNGSKNEQQKQKVFKANDELSQSISRIGNLMENYPQLRSNETFMKILDELEGTQNRMNVARKDYLELIENSSSKPRRLTKTQTGEGSARWLDNERILFSQGGNLFVINIENFFLAQISRESNPQTFISVSGATPTENNEFIAYTVSDGSKQKTIIVPTYIDELVQAPPSRRGFTEQKVLVAKADGSLEKSIEIELPKTEADSFLQGVEWLADNKTLIVDRVDKTHKRRQIFVVQIENDKSNAFLVHEETDEKWIGGPARILEANPKNADQFFFGSETDGWHHLFLVNLNKTKFADKKANAEIKQITDGNWEIDWAQWTADGKQIVYSSTQENYSGREFFAAELQEQGNFTFNKIPSVSKGMKLSPQIDETTSSPVLLYESSEWNKPGELFAVEICPRCQKTPVPKQLTRTTPELFLKRKWNAPQFIEINSRDNKKIPAKIYLPENFNKSKKYPVVVFVHGAGYLQNVINGWNNYYREFMFNELLTQKGYVVLDIDYRGSAGYGRDWRTDVYDFLGGKDYDDHLDAIDYMVANYAVDAKRVGVYGGSYGGFMAAMLVMRAPDKIAAAAALRPVMDWKNYYAVNAFYTSQRLRSPKENPEGYKQSSPINYAEKLEKPLLILHGLVDSNVQAQDSFQLVEKLIRLNKTQYFESMFYPAENHAFTRATSWNDEYARILTFFEKHLQ